MQDLFEVHEGGEVRRLGLLEQPESALTLAWPTMFGPDGSPNPIEKSRWRPTSLESHVLRIHDQNGVGMCASSGTVGAYEIAREIAGLEPIPFSAGDLYRRVSDGRDQGSLPEDNLKELMANGLVPETVCPYLDWRNNYDKTGAIRPVYRGLEAWVLPTTAHLATALMMGFSCEIGYWHHQSDPTDESGWMTHPTGRRGGHAVRAIGLVMRNGMVGFKFANSWRTTWGAGGIGILPETRVAEGLQSFSSWALRAPLSQSVNLPPLKAVA